MEEELLIVLTESSSLTMVPDGSMKIVLLRTIASIIM